jgi:uncharacterized membrane protein
LFHLYFPDIFDREDWKSKMPSQESPSRSLAKALSWRLLATVITASLAWAITGEVRVAAAIGAADTALKLVVYYVHERVWARVAFGRPASPDYEI